MKVSNFWQSGGNRRLTKEWQERDQQLRREAWNNRTPAELISQGAWKRLPAKRRQAIERAAYERGLA
ncbi:MAG: hypothetical protein M3R24_00830 [Chloroflexota bacterium]|nr:hypothetical protein [Chloroflexota bacterium]